MAIAIEDIESDSLEEFKKGVNYFLGIGINNYLNFPLLYNAIKDIQDIIEVLLDNYYFEQNNIITLIDNDASRENIIQEISDLRKKVKPIDRVIIYYSGHGHMDEELGFWIPADARHNRIATYVGNSEVQSIIKTINAKHILLISDSCFSSSLLVRDILHEVGKPYIDYDRDPSRWVFTSGKGLVSDGIKGKNSPFAEEILNYLKSEKKIINIVELADAVTKRVGFNYEQHAECHPMYQSGHKGGQFVFFKKPRKTSENDTNDTRNDKIKYPAFQASEREWSEILERINDQLSVLFLGPNVIPTQNKTLNSYIFNDLCTKYKNDLFHYYENDSFHYYEKDDLLLFNSLRSKSQAKRHIQSLYKEILPDDSLLKQIVQIPFHLVVSVNPDTFLSETFYRYGIRHRFHHLKSNNYEGEHLEIEKPTKAAPLILNLFGSKDDYDSIILDHDDMFNMFQAVLNDTFIPMNVLREFRVASTFIFVGFQFDKWYIQLLLKYLLKGGRHKEIISINNSLIDNDTYNFLTREFQILFVDDDLQFFNEIYKRCSKRGTIRNITDESASKKSIEIRKLVANGNIREALEILHNASAKSDWENDVIILKGRYNIIEDSKHKTDIRDYRIGLSQILDYILDLSKKV